ncbi:LysE family translocator [Microbulbifer taiwanensis]|uniref:LysE family translocator n=1 Tax=Microbulbifer taiwanensis TaxID=986746 RepID=A0ABW1YJU8_9GAMM|nr:LysE family translocator [Microbulbifer taiwanensis]
MSVELWLAFSLASVVLLMIPGPTILTVISYSATQGSRARWPLVAAVALGDAVALTMSLLGLGALLAASAAWFVAVKWVGGLYLLYLGVRLLRAGVEPLAGNPEPAALPRRRLFADTFLVTALNPKGIVFFVAFLPQFVDTEAALLPQFALLGMTFVLLAGLNTALYSLFAASARGALGSPRALRRFNLAGGSLMSLAGIWTLLARRPVAS